MENQDLTFKTNCRNFLCILPKSMCGLDLYLSLIRSYITTTMAAVVVVIVVVVSGAETNRPALINDETMLL